MQKQSGSAGDIDEDFGRDGSLISGKGEMGDFLVRQGQRTLMLARNQQRYVLSRFDDRGEMDSTFGVDGYLDDTFDEAGHSTVSSLQFDAASGVISVCGRVRLGGVWQSAISRYDFDGRPAVGASPMAAQAPDRTVFNFYRQETAYAGFASFLVAVTRDDQPDLSFNGSGSLELTYQGQALQIRSVTAHTDGYLVTASQPGGNGVASALVARVRQDGTLDTRFGPDGSGFCSWAPPGEICAFSTLVVSADDTLIVIGTAARNGEPKILCWSLTAQGRPRTPQPVILAPHLAYPQIATATRLPGGRIIVSGSSQIPGSFERGGLLLGLTDQGALDPGFAETGWLLSAPYREYLAVSADESGGVQVAGHVFDLDDFESTPTVWRYWAR